MSRNATASRRAFAIAAVCVLGAALALAFASDAADRGRRVIVLGFDGMDYEMTRKLMSEGRLPNFSKLAGQGIFQPLGTSVPPQSPVAWSNFITGMDAGGHGIFDFIHRDPKTMIPYLSTSKTAGSEKTFKIGKWQIPLSGGKVELLRHGEAFWERLESEGVKTKIMRMPANFPPSGTASAELSGMGTPDILGTYGTFTFFTSNREAIEAEEPSKKIVDVRVRDNVATCKLIGPTNPFLQEKKKLESELKVYIDPVNPVAKIVAGDEERVVQVGEFTDWIPLQFDMIKTQKLHGMCRFYLKQVRPDFMLYASPINIDPMQPALPISTPVGLAKELGEASGRFYTQGMPEDTKALSEGVFTREEFLKQAQIAGDEIIEQYERELLRFEEGLLFYYFGNNDQVDHMMWRTCDPTHPAYVDSLDARFSDVVPGIYEKMDAVVGYTLEHMKPGTKLLVMSDHGFTSWKRAFHLNSWLRDQGYLAVLDPDREDDPGLFANVDWTRTVAYGLGLNGLYVNLRGREKWGIVNPADRDSLLEDISKRLLETIDPKTGEPAVTKAYRTDRTYEHKEYLDIAPDIIVGYAKGMRGSNESALGEIPKEVIIDNHEEWSGDHCMDHEAVPGILLLSEPLGKRVSSLQNLASAILGEFGVQGFEEGGEASLEALGYVQRGN